jgi:hypothetical protein
MTKPGFFMTRLNQIFDSNHPNDIKNQTMAVEEYNEKTNQNISIEEFKMRLKNDKITITDFNFK